MLILFPIVAAIVLCLWHYYLWTRLVKDTHLPLRWRSTAKTALVALGLGFPATMIATRFAPVGPIADNFKLAFIVGFGWLGTSFIIINVLIVGDLAKLAIRTTRRIAKSDTADPQRRTTIARIIAITATLSGVTISATGAASAFGIAAIERVRVRLRRLSPNMSGTRLVQLSDMHVGPTLRKPWVQRVVAQVQSLDPDLVVITGDLVDGSVQNLREHIEPLSELRTRFGVFFVTGNHEYYSNADAWVQELTRIGIRVLRNEHVLIGNGNDAFALAGVDDWSSKGREGGHNVAAAVDGLDESREVVLLAHQPRSITDAVKHGVGVQLSGHTHGGQIYPWYHAVFFQQPYVSGLHLVRGSWLYVNRGTGFWGPPMRVGAPPEITVVELVNAEQERTESV